MFDQAHLPYCCSHLTPTINLIPDRSQSFQQSCGLHPPHEQALHRQQWTFPLQIAYHADGNLILQQAFKNRSDIHCIAAYNAIMTCLAACGLLADLQILDNKASAACKQAITFTWQAKFQLVPPDMHHRNHAEHMIWTFKDHFLSILIGVDPSFSPYLWDLLLPQAELTLNLLQQAALNPWISTWEVFNGPFDFNKIPLRPVGCRVLVHAKPATWLLWDYRTKEGFFIGPTLDFITEPEKVGIKLE
jgi:hypothetical protein